MAALILTVFKHDTREDGKNHNAKKQNSKPDHNIHDAGDQLKPTFKMGLIIAGMLAIQCALPANVPGGFARISDGGGYVRFGLL